MRVRVTGSDEVWEAVARSETQRGGQRLNY